MCDRALWAAVIWCKWKMTGRTTFCYFHSIQRSRIGAMIAPQTPLLVWTKTISRQTVKTNLMIFVHYARRTTFHNFLHFYSDRRQWFHVCWYFCSRKHLIWNCQTLLRKLKALVNNYSVELQFDGWMQNRHSFVWKCNIHFEYLEYKYGNLKVLCEFLF